MKALQIIFALATIAQAISDDLSSIGTGSNCGISSSEPLCSSKKKNSLNTNECSRTDDLYNRNGQYLKSLCTVSKALNYNQAKKACEDNGMSLFILTSNDVQKAFLKAADGRFADRRYARLWINGRKDAADNWYAEISNYHVTNVDWYNGKNNEGKCLSVLKHHQNEQMKASGWDCSRIAWGYCEFINLEISECSSRMRDFNFK